MTKTLPKTDEGDEFITFRGPQTSVTHDRTGVRFTTTDRNGRRVHQPVRVVDPDDDVDDDQPVIARQVADYLTESNPLVCWGVVCEHTDGSGSVCGATFSTPESLNSHLSVHADSDTDDDGGDD